MLLADVDARIARAGRQRVALGLFGVVATFTILYFGDRMPYVMMHDGLLMPLFGCSILGLAGENILARFFGWTPFLLFGQTSYCLYILHFNLWTLIHDSGLLDRTGLIRFDPWVSYMLLFSCAGLALVLIERPFQKKIRAMFA